MDLPTDWTLERYSAGSMISHSPPGLPTRFGHAIRTPWSPDPLGRYANSPVMHGFVDWAIRSGERAATDLVDAPLAAVAVRVDQSLSPPRQIAPTILVRLHLDPKKLQDVVAENTATLPGL